jgi:hypothetical protein
VLSTLHMAVGHEECINNSKIFRFQVLHFLTGFQPNVACNNNTGCPNDFANILHILVALQLGRAVGATA